MAALTGSMGAGNTRACCRRQTTRTFDRPPWPAARRHPGGFACSRASRSSKRWHKIARGSEGPSELAGTRINVLGLPRVAAQDPNRINPVRCPTDGR